MQQRGAVPMPALSTGLTTQLQAQAPIPAFQSTQISFEKMRFFFSVTHTQIRTNMKATNEPRPGHSDPEPSQ